LKDSCVLVSRVGGVGGADAHHLAAAGLGKLILAHAGNVRPSVLNRQLRVTHEWMGKRRIDVIQKRFLDLNPRFEIIAVAEYIKEEKAARIIGPCDVIVDCAPRFKERFTMKMFDV